MTTIDLHYHANVSGLPRHNRISRLRKIRRTFERHGLDCVASTEHSYKKPLASYQWLADAAEGSGTHILPGVECVSSEGIDIIYLYRTEDDLRCALNAFHSFSWDIHEVERIREDTGAIVSVPHPFHVCRSAAGNVMSARAYRQLLRKVDYVEVHNGSALTINKRLGNSCTRSLFKKTRAKLDRTLELPLRDRGRALGWAVGSDAHYHNEQYVVGSYDGSLPAGGDWYDLLQQRVRFQPHYLHLPSEYNTANNIRLLRSLQSAMREGIIKEFLRTRRRSATVLASLLLLYGRTLPFK